MRQEDMGFLPYRSCIQHHTIHCHNPGPVIDMDYHDDDMEHRADIAPLLYLQTTRSTIVTFVACIICNLIPTDISSIPLCTAMGCFGSTLTASSISNYLVAKKEGRETEYLLDE